ncbi:hypothetical protein Acid345_3955 [Candidatus Koribacter versatilis Ellin345]|uniref:Uncharacterized protein n=1 Tax=Koribacter versatilis (strain Ellin345) TaxID=204669 RepID=Q1IJJ5_KORVE|nr:hypothetical protein [Candidatus Koribacter versatilis]ABF42955.1 hypothetical protein Acid345_3955 [Candidatus Koribacter versatilis Ellin345]
MTASASDGLVHLDASTFQKPLGQLAEVLAQKLHREAPKLLPAPTFVAVDLFVLMRKAMRTYDLLFYLNADERRNSDCYWRSAYSVLALSLIRTMIDCLYNITTILQAPAANGALFRKSGFQKSLRALDDEEQRYGGQPKWDEYIARGRSMIDLGLRESGFTLAEINSQKWAWHTLGQYLSYKPGGRTTAHQDFLRTFAYGNWREYSAMSHSTFEGLMPTAMYYVADTAPHDNREMIEQRFELVLFMHIGRAAGLLLCIITELQAHFKFDDDGARINERIHEMWDALMPVFEIKELYDGHYRQRMKARGI